MSKDKQSDSEILERILIDKRVEISEAEVDYYITHPEEIDTIIDREVIQLAFLKFGFGLALVLMIGSTLLSYYFADSWGEFINDLVLDIIKEIGIAILGGVITVYFIEIIQKKQYEANVQYRRTLLRKIAERKNEA